ncbi:hypothetical protein ACHRV1_16040 [Flavobacterium aquidurense]|uniref:Transcriptional regulator n=1 Tax=Flavobacterium piscisymbiosum TaxID=2893753 RepID=A0ABS8MKK7_9FLAO|nr:hypothetical protein [Flavobacterium sp. F-30]MCC9066029.1 hypothetical protein [Flavobacterium sp. F-30]
MATNKSISLGPEGMLSKKHICNFIAKKWIVDKKDEYGKDISFTSYGNQCDLVTSTISKIASDEGYNIPINTLIKILRKEEMTLSQFFIECEREYL